MTVFKYWGFGLQIASEIEFPELFPFEFEQADLTIDLGITPQQLTGDDLVQKVRVAMRPDEYLLEVMNIAHYYAAQGNRIIVQPMPGADEKSIRLFLLSNAMAAILHQRDVIPFHASAVLHQGSLTLFCGRSGAGKSTLATALQLKGYQVFSDDVCVLKQDVPSDKLLAHTSYPMVKLWEDTFAKVGLEAAAEADKIRPQMAKYARFFHHEFNRNAYPVKQVFVLDPDTHVNTSSLKRLNTLEAFSKLQENTYRYLQMDAMKKRSIHFGMISKLTAQASVYQLCRPYQGNSIAEIIKLVEPYFPEHE